MIFVTVGTQLPFDRLIKAIDTWAAKHPQQTIFAQVGDSLYQAQHIQTVSNLPLEEFNQKITQSSMIISHAGMGSILAAMQYQKPILVMPRQLARQEIRSDHQLDTIKHLCPLVGIDAVMDESALINRLNERELPRIPKALRPYASEPLLDSIKHFIASPHST